MTDPASSQAQGRAGGSVYGELLERLLAEEEARKQSIEQRGLQLVSAVAALVTLLLALVSLVVHEVAATAPVVRWLLVLSIGAFVAAGGLAIVTNLPQGYQVFGQSSLERMVERRFWDGDAATAAWRVAQLRAQIIKQTRANNRAKARRLRQAVYALGAGIGLLGLSAAILLLRR